MNNWWNTHAPAIEAASGAVTAIVAILALLGIFIQLSAADKLAREQSARDAYRSHLALAVSNPEFSQPESVCATVASSKGGAYEAFVDHLVYSAEQMLASEEGWEPTFLAAIRPHAPYLCAKENAVGETAEMRLLLKEFRSETCRAITPCAE